MSVLQKDATGMEVSRKLLTVNRETNEIAIDFRTPANKLDAQALSAEISSFLIDDKVLDNKSEITRQRNTYDENGFLIRSLYQRDNLGTPACDSNSVYGKTYEYDDRGLIVRIHNLDETGELHNCKYGWAYKEFVYDENGYFIRKEYLDAQGQLIMNTEGYAIIHIIRNREGRILRSESLDTTENLTMDNFLGLCDS